MPCRINSLSGLALYTVLAALLAASRAHAHRLDAQVFSRPNREIQVESWFSNGDAAKGARVQVFGPQDQLITEGQLNDQGIFIFSYGDTQPCRVVISAGAGHRKELSISPGALARALADTTDKDFPVRAKADLPAAMPLAERDSGPPLKEILLGVGFVLALAAFILSLRNARKLRLLARLHERALLWGGGRGLEDKGDG